MPFNPYVYVYDNNGEVIQIMFPNIMLKFLPSDISKTVLSFFS